jgi:hypothetical protein
MEITGVFLPNSFEEHQKHQLKTGLSWSQIGQKEEATGEIGSGNPESGNWIKQSHHVQIFFEGLQKGMMIWRWCPKLTDCLILLELLSRKKILRAAAPVRILAWISTLILQLHLQWLRIREDYPIPELIFGIVGYRFIPHYSWDKPIIAYSYAFISLSHVTCAQKYAFHADIWIIHHTTHNLHLSKLELMQLHHWT